jgi:MinD superfamily P-loop ATPase
MIYQIVPENCNKCGNCMDVCMNGAIIDFLDFYQIDPSWCLECGVCAEFCFENAIFYDGIQASELLTEKIAMEDSEYHEKIFVFEY